MPPNIFYKTHITYAMLNSIFLMNGQVFTCSPKRICDISHMRFNAYEIYCICDLVLNEYMQFTFIYAYEDDDEQ